MSMVRLLIQGTSSTLTTSAKVCCSEATLFRRSRTGIILLCFLALSTGLRAQLVYQEDFNYSGQLSSHGWVPFSNTGNSPINAGAAGLFYAGDFNLGGGNGVSITLGANAGGDEHEAAAQITRGRM